MIKITNLFNKLKNILYPFHPIWILMNYRYSKKWDQKLNYLMDNQRFENISNYVATIGEYTLWIENYPYASFCNDGVRPSRKTIRRAMRRVKIDSNYQTKSLSDIRDEKINDILNLN